MDSNDPPFHSLQGGYLTDSTGFCWYVELNLSDRTYFEYGAFALNSTGTQVSSHQEGCLGVMREREMGGDMADSPCYCFSGVTTCPSAPSGNSPSYTCSTTYTYSCSATVSKGTTRTLLHSAHPLLDPPC